MTALSRSSWLPIVGLIPVVATPRTGSSQTPELCAGSTIAAGYSHSLAVRIDGTVWAWGENNYGQLGDGTTENRSVPVRVHGPTGVVAVSAGSYTSMALTRGGIVWEWGARGGSLPQVVSGLPLVRAIDAGPGGAVYPGRSLVVARTGAVWGWGTNYHGELGTADPVETLTSFPPGEVLGLSNVERVVARGAHSYALRTNGTVWAWGKGCALLADGSPITPTACQAGPIAPTQVQNVPPVRWLDDQRVVDNSGLLWVWVVGRGGELADGLARSSGVPVLACLSKPFGHCNYGYGNIAPPPGDGGPVEKVTEVSGRLALRADGTVWAVGDNSSYQLGEGLRDSALHHVPVPGMEGVIEISAGGAHNLAVRADGQVWAWGSNRAGALGAGHERVMTVPVPVVGLGPVARRECPSF